MEKKDQIQAEALEASLPHHRCGIVAGTGVGKTRLGLMHMNHHYIEGDVFLVVAPRKKIFDEWKAEAKAIGLDHLVKAMKFTTYRSLPDRDQNAKGVYLDECHSLLPSHELWLRSYGGRILGLTGTEPVMSYSTKAKLIAEFCPIVYRYETDEAVEDELLNDYEIFLIGVDLDKNKTIEVKTKKNTSFFVSEEQNYAFWTEKVTMAATPKQKQIAAIMRMKALQGFKSKERACALLLPKITDKCIIFANTKAQADKLCRNSHHSGNPLSAENLEYFKTGAIMRLSAVDQLSEGVNIPGLKVIVILHAYGNERKSAQRIGRGLRLPVDQKATIYIFFYKNTVDEIWVKDALVKYNPSKISYI